MINSLRANKLISYSQHGFKQKILHNQFVRISWICNKWCRTNCWMEWVHLFQTVATEILHTTGSRASAVLLMFPMPSTRLLERQRATVWGLQKSPLSVSEIQRLAEFGCMEQEAETVARHQSIFASPSDSLSMRWPGKPSLLAKHCSSKHLQISCPLDQKKGIIFCYHSDCFYSATVTLC